MLNCTLLLDSAFRFGLGEGTGNFPSDAEKIHFLGVHKSCLDLPSKVY